MDQVGNGAGRNAAVTFPIFFMFLFAIALLIGEYCFALIIKAMFGLKFEPLMVPILTVIVGFAAFFLFIIFALLSTIFK